MFLVGGTIGVEWLLEPLGMLSLVWFLVIFFAPFVLVPLHLRYQSPREHSVTLAFVTGVGSWLLFWCVLIINSAT